MCFHCVEIFRLGLCTNFFVSVSEFSRSMGIFFLGFPWPCMAFDGAHSVKSVCTAGDTRVMTMAYAHKHVFSLSTDISPRPVHNIFIT